MNEPIRVLHVVQRMEAGGTQALLMNIYRNIDRSKVQFDFLVEYPNKEFYDDEILSMGGKIYYTTVRIDFNLVKFKNQLEEILNENHEYKIMHVHVSSIGYLCFSVAKKCGINVRIAHAHNNNSIKDIKNIPRAILRKLYILNATDYFACSYEAGKYFFKEKKFTILNNAIDSKKFIYNQKIRDKVRKSLNIDDYFVVGNVGRLHMQKNQLFLIDVFNEILKEKEKSKLIIVGNGPLEKKIKEKIEKLKLKDNVIMFNNRNDINELLQAMDIFILPSVFEGLGIVAIESQAASTPILISSGVSDMTMISPICEKYPLKESARNWSQKAISLANKHNKREDMQKYIINSQFDIKSISKVMQEYYLKKS